tara:strand:+ start:7044 stop:7931 length:888 start_codon:yes stop_codon:yes gene_type:complete
MTNSITDATPNASPTRSSTRRGLNITLSERVPVSASDEWQVAGWKIQFVRLGPDQLLALNQTQGDVYLKVVTGAIANTGITPFAADREVRNTRVQADHVRAGPEGALVTVLVATPAVDKNVTSMDQLAFTGPLEEVFVWDTFEALFGSFIEAFNGVDAHMVPGFHILDDSREEIVHLHFWTAGKGVDLTTHNHADDPSEAAPAFVEVHWVLNNGCGSGSMYETPEPGAAHRKRYPMQRGEEHGPFFHHEGGRPRFLDNGAVDYPWHGWEAGDDGTDGQSYDFVAAFEINPAYCRI